MDGVDTTRLESFRQLRKEIRGILSRNFEIDIEKKMTSRSAAMINVDGHELPASNS